MCHGIKKHFEKQPLSYFQIHKFDSDLSFLRLMFFFLTRFNLFFKLHFKLFFIFYFNTQM